MEQLNQLKFNDAKITTDENTTTEMTIIFCESVKIMLIHAIKFMRVISLINRSPIRICTISEFNSVEGFIHNYNSFIDFVCLYYIIFLLACQ